MARSCYPKFFYCVLNVIIRLILIYVAYVIDTNSSTVKFTDTDYDVFSDAAAHVAAGNSPYLRKTYRYTPLASYICIVNSWIHPLACKFVFVVFDIILAYMIWDICELQLKKSSWKYTQKTVALFTSALLLNPMFVVMSCRGSNDVII